MQGVLSRNGVEVWIREVKDFEGRKFEVVDDLYSPNALSAFSDLSEALSEALFYVSGI